MTATPAKFTFDLDLGSKRQRTPILTQSQIDELQTTARAEGYAEGVADGQKSEIALAAANLNAAAEKLSATAVDIFASVDAIERKTRVDAIALARAVGLKLASSLVAREPEAELEPLIAECLASLERAPHLVVRCHPALTDTIKNLVEAHISASGYAGRLIVMGDPDIGSGDGRLEWADGGLVRDMNVILEAIDNSIQAYCAAAELEAPDVAGLTETIDE